MPKFEVGQKVKVTAYGWTKGKEIIIQSVEPDNVPRYFDGEFWYSESDFASDTDDSGYSELIDKLSGRIKGLERELAAMPVDTSSYAKGYAACIQDAGPQVESLRHNNTMLNAENTRLRAERDTARNAAALWKHTAKSYYWMFRQWCKFELAKVRGAGDPAREQSAFAQAAQGDVAQGSAFRIGQRVRITAPTENMYGIRGTEGELLSEHQTKPGYWHVKVFFPGTQSDDFWLPESDFVAIEQHPKERRE
jgi:hypothetical protein